MNHKALPLLLTMMSLTSFSSADTMTLKNGSVIHGHYAGGDGATIRFASGNHENSYDLKEVESIKFASPSSTSPAASTHSPSTAHAAASRMQIPSGTEVAIRLIDPVDSKEDRLGQTYRASVDRPIVINGETIIGRGSDATTILSEAQQSGKIRGTTVLTIALRTVTVNGRRYDLDTSSVSKSSGSRGARSGRRIGGGAAVGAIIGGIAGGGKGVAIGAASGGAVGTAAQVATSGERVKIPAETLLTFTLQSPLHLSNTR